LLNLVAQFPADLSARVNGYAFVPIKADGNLGPGVLTSHRYVHNKKRSAFQDTLDQTGYFFLQRHHACLNEKEGTLVPSHHKTT
jgi:hypothetical protein